MIFKRKKYLDKIYSYLKTEKLIILYWARQVWKTTLLKTLISDKKIKEQKIYINFDDLYEKKFSSKDEFLKFLEFNYSVNFEKKGILFLDEIQSVENIEQILKSLYDDENIKLRIIATWSWLWQIKKIWSTLVWRIKQIFIYPFSFFEFLELKWVNINFLNVEKYESFMFDKIKIYLEEYYLFWWYPAVVLENTKEKKIEKLSEIIEIYLRKDIQFFLGWSELISFKKMFAYLANNIWSAINISRLSSFLWVSRDKTEKYLDILEKSFLLHKVQAFFSNSKKEYSKQYEFYLSDLWMINFFRNNFNFIEFDWNLVENFSYLEILKNKKINSDDIKTYNKINWSEIDFIYQFKEWWITPIEVKISDSEKIPKIFYSFFEDYKDEVNFFVRTSLKEVYKKNDEKFTIKIIPFWMLWNFWIK